MLLFIAFAFPSLARADSPTHVVTYGETLYSIARNYGISPQALASANGITTQSWVYAGQRLRIPTDSNPNNSAPLSVAQISPGGNYVVRAGDTLSSLSRKFGVSVNAIADANNIPPNGFLYTGWQLKIPDTQKTNSAPAPQNNPPANNSTTQPSLTQTAAYIVRPGDTLFGIALRHNITVAALRLANNLPTSFVYSGQRLIIPGAASTTVQLSNTPNNAPAPNNSAQVANSSAISGSALRVENIPSYRQQQTLTCEESAASMALRGALTEAQIVAAMPRSPNPFEGIRGKTNYELLGGLEHYGTYAQGLQKGLAKLGRQSTAYYGQPYIKFQASILENLKQGRAVIWWTTWHETNQQPQWIEISKGIKIPLTPYEHTVVIVAANDHGVTYHDPYDGTTRFATWANHQRTSGYFNNMALVIY